MNTQTTITPTHLERVIDAVDGVLLHTVATGAIYAGTGVLPEVQKAIRSGSREVILDAEGVRQWIADADGDLTVAAEALTASLDA